MLRTAEADAGDDAGAFIHGASWLNRSKRRKVHSEIIRALRQGTRSASTTLHHARHSFAMRVLEALLASNPEYSNVLPDPSPASIAEQLLGHPHQTRRGLWALARALGHAGLETSITSYIHLLDEWADQVADEVVRKRLRRPALACENLDLLPRAKRTPEPEGPPPPRQPSCADAIRLLRLAARNTPPEVAALHLGLDEARCSELCLAAASIDKSGSAHSPFHLVTENQWTGLLECAKRLDEATSPRRNPLRGRPTPAAAAVLVGRQRQFLMAAPEHFAWVRSFVDDFNIPSHLYAVTATDLNHPVLAEQAELCGFALTRRTDLSATGTQQQIDALSLDGGFSLVRHRCALLFRENAEFAIRNRIGLVLLLLAWAVTGHQPK